MKTVESSDNLSLKNIYELLGKKFFIPAYQRGYRWTEIQVRELLDDIWEFTRQDAADKSAFYCLQPVVVAKRDESWELVDGQQRLTTIYLILHYLEKEHLRRELSEAYKESIYSIEYETRPKSTEFLNNIQPSSETSNIDFFYIAQAYEVISNWFSERDYNENNELLATLLAKPENGQSIKVIWYDLTNECNGNDYAIDVFSRINIGKIPLTNAELVKALFLQRQNTNAAQAKLKQIQIATDWDNIEKQLQESDFWCFIYNADRAQNYETRIEYIFDLMMKKKAGDEPYFTFHKFNAEFKSTGADIDGLWKQVKDYFLTFDEWYRDRELYHLIGFLVDCGHNVGDLKVCSETQCQTKSDFKDYLRKEIAKEVDCQLVELEYGNAIIKKILLLFNIQSLLSTKEADVRFPFNRYKNERWDIEHIQSRTDTVLTGKARFAWLDDMYEFLTGSNLFKEEIIQEFIDRVKKVRGEDEINDNDFNELYEEVNAYFVKDDFSLMNELGNLALLDATTNRSYKNALFPVKRARIIQNEMRGIFVPICTKNVFLKFYSRSSSDLMYWSKQDADDYVNAIAEMLHKYLPEQGGVND